MSLSNLVVVALPVVANLAFQTAGDVPSDDIVAIIRQVLNLGIGGILSLIFWYLFKEERQKREAAESRYQALLMRLAKIPPVETPDLPSD